MRQQSAGDACQERAEHTAQTKLIVNSCTLVTLLRFTVVANCIQRQSCDYSSLMLRCAHVLQHAPGSQQLHALARERQRGGTDSSQTCRQAGSQTDRQTGVGHRRERPEIEKVVSVERDGGQRDGAKQMVEGLQRQLERLSAYYCAEGPLLKPDAQCQDNSIHGNSTCS